MDERFKNYTLKDLEEQLSAVTAEIQRRKNARAKKLIDRVCDALNGLQSLGVTFTIPNENDYDIVFDRFITYTFTPENFKLPEVK